MACWEQSREGSATQKILETRDRVLDPRQTMKRWKVQRVLAQLCERQRTIISSDEPGVNTQNIWFRSWGAVPNGAVLENGHTQRVVWCRFRWPYTLRGLRVPRRRQLNARVGVRCCGSGFSPGVNVQLSRLVFHDAQGIVDVNNRLLRDRHVSHNLAQSKHPPNTASSHR